MNQKGQSPRERNAQNGTLKNHAVNSMKTDVVRATANIDMSVCTAEADIERENVKRKQEQGLQLKAKCPCYLREFLWRDDDPPIGATANYSLTTEPVLNCPTQDTKEKGGKQLKLIKNCFKLSHLLIWMLLNVSSLTI